METATSLPGFAESIAKPQFYEWAFPGAPVRIFVNLDIIPRIREHLMCNSAADADQPAEAGGILLGTATVNCVEITGFEPFACERGDGRFIISDGDGARFRELVDQSSRAGSSVRVVGYFRSQFREDPLRLYPEDLALVNAFFRDPLSVFLIIRPATAEDSPEAGFFFWDSGEVFADFTFMPFPFDEHLLTSSPRTAMSQVVYPADGGRSPVVARTPAGQPGANAAGRRLRLRVAAAVLGLAILALSAAVLSRAVRRSPAILQPDPLAQAMSLSIIQSGSDITITWNPASAPLRNARVGMLSIQDGNIKREVPLTPQMLQESRIVYAPASEAVQVGLEVFSHQGKSAREAIVFIPRSSSGRSTSLITGDEPPSFKVTVPVSVPAQTATASGTRVRGRSVRRFEAPLSTSAASTTSSVIPAPTIVIDQAEPYLLTQDASSILTAVAGSNIAGPPPIQSESAPPNRSVDRRGAQRADTQPEQSAPAQITSRPHPVLIPPKPIRQVRPELSANVKKMFSGEVQIQVKVIIDAAGKVTHAEPLVSKGAITEYLGKVAAAAARVWKFEPARLDGQAVPSELLLQFRFAPEKAKW